MALRQIASGEDKLFSAAGMVLAVDISLVFTSFGIAVQEHFCQIYKSDKLAGSHHLSPLKEKSIFAFTGESKSKSQGHLR